MTVTAEKTVREIALENPSGIRVFETLGIDYCCGGKRSLSDACARAKVPLEQVRELLANAQQSAPEDGADNWHDAPLRELTAHIVARHHAFVREESPVIQTLLNKVISRHGATHPEVRQIEDLFLAMARELNTHMLKEEQVLFPYIEKMEAAVLAGQAPPDAFFGPVTGPIAHMMADHDDAGALMARMRKLSGDFTPPPDSCPTYVGLYHSLAAFENDLHRHVHLENNILFPRTAGMAASSEEAPISPGRS